MNYDWENNQNMEIWLHLARLNRLYPIFNEFGNLNYDFLLRTDNPNHFINISGNLM